MNYEADIRAAIASEFGDAVEYRKTDHRSLLDCLAELSSEAEWGANLAVLVPNATETRWFQQYCFPWEVRFIHGRVIWDGERRTPLQGSALVLMGPLAKRGRTVFWRLERQGQLSDEPATRRILEAAR